MRIAAVGCGHGELDTIYAAAKASERATKVPIDAVVICGDFEAIRNASDLEQVAGPKKFRKMGDFHKYYSGKTTAPYLTIVIGGNHECSSYFMELYHGGWLAPNIYFLGYAGVVQLGSLRIAGVSGIYAPEHFLQGRFEHPPYTGSSDIHSVYCTRQHELIQLTQLSSAIDLFLSHDWPRNILAHADRDAAAAVYAAKPTFVPQVLNGMLGSPALEHLLMHLRPTQWLAGHMHVRVETRVAHHDNRFIAPETADLTHFTHLPPPPLSYMLPGGPDNFGDADPVPGVDASTTSFVGISKCVKNREFLELVDFPNHRAGPLRYDCDWLAIMAATHADLRFDSAAVAVDDLDWSDLAKRIAVCRESIADSNLEIPTNAFAMTAPGYNPKEPAAVTEKRRAAVYVNPQTVAIRNLLGLQR
ncbi:lariat debranching enzyme, C-terminal domain-containing protein [Blastocladiella britannica]|nr:lariat debranching enzyme, C-terminal domain-containing protein [Blastocladiella britannica]